MVLAGARRAQLFGPLGGVELDAKADAPHVLLEALIELALEVVGRGVHHQIQGLAVGRIAAAVAVLVDIAEGVEQALGAGRVEVAVFGLELGVVGAGVGYVGALRRDGLAAAHHANLGLGVHGEADGAAQRHLVGRHATNNRVVHVEHVEEDFAVQCPVERHALLDQVGRKLSAGRHLGDEVLRHPLNEVMLLVQEAQPTRLVLVNDADFDPVDHRNAPAFELGEQRLALGVVGIRFGVVEALAVGGVALQHDERSPAPLGEHEGPCAHRVRHDLVAVLLHHLARHGAVQIGLRQLLQKARAGFGEGDADRVAVDGFQAGNGRVVVEGLLAGLRLLAGFFQALDAPGLHRRPAGAGDGGVGVAGEAVDVVLRHQLALLAAKGGVVGEVDAGLDARRPDGEVGIRLGHRLGGQGLELGGPREVVVGDQALEDVRRDHPGVEVLDARGVKAGFGHAEGVAQHLLVFGQGGREQAQGQQAGGKEFHGAALLVLMSTYSHQFTQKRGRR